MGRTPVKTTFVVKKFKSESLTNSENETSP